MKQILKTTWEELIFSALFFYAGWLAGNQHIPIEGFIFLILFNAAGLIVKYIRYRRLNYGNQNPITPALEK